MGSDPGGPAGGNPRGPDAFVAILFGTHRVKPVVIAESISSIAENNAPGVDAQKKQGVKWLGAVCEAIRTFGHGVLNSESTTLRISLVSSPTEDLVLGDRAVPADARWIASDHGLVGALLDSSGRILQYRIAKGTPPGVLVLGEGANAFIREK